MIFHRHRHRQGGNSSGVIDLALSTTNMRWSALLLFHLIIFCSNMITQTYGFRNNVRQDVRTGGGKSSFGPSRFPRSLAVDNHVHGQQTLSSSTTTTSLFAKMKFKNFDYFLETFSSNEEPILLCFTTSMCGPCKLMNKELQNVNTIMMSDARTAESYRKLKLFSIDTEKWPQLSNRFDISRLPCILIWQNGQVMYRMEGVTKAEDVVKEIIKLI